MKLTIFLMLIFAMQLSAFVPTHGQVTLNVQNEPIRDVFKEIETQSPYRFFYNEAFADLNKRIDISVDDKDINSTMDELLLMSDMAYKVLDNNLVVIAPRKELQQLEVTGRVVDAANGESLPGVSIMVEGTTIGVVTNAEGNYSLTVPGPDAVLVFSFIGYTSEKVGIEGRSVINIQLKPELQALDEIVVIGYGTQRRVNVIGSVTTIRDEDITRAPVANVTNALAGMLPGAIVRQSSGEPGRDESVILIRGKATLGHQAPLIVVDGIPDRDMGSLAASDIESITVLKDASAAIYGSRAANGVILVQTKRGVQDTPAMFTYNFYQGVLSPTMLAEMADAPTYASMIREMQSYRGVDESNMMFSLDDIAKFESGEYPWTHPNTNWYDEVLSDFSETRNHNFSVRGGASDINYYGSFATQFDDAIYANSTSYYKRYNIKAAVDAKVNDYITVGVDLTGSEEDSMYPARGQGTVFANLIRSFPTSHARFPNGLPGPDIERGDNPVVISGPEPGWDDITTHRLNTTLRASIDVPFISGLSFSGYYNYEKYYRERKHFMRRFNLYALDRDAYLAAGNTGKEDGSDFLIANQRGEVPATQVQDYYDDRTQGVLNLMANYDKTINDVHNINVFFAYESSDYTEKGINAFRRGFMSDQLPYLFAGGTDQWTNDGYIGIDARENYFGRFMYNYDETYLFQFSLRRDGSLRFSEEVGRWGTFPSVLIGWRISNEDFWADNVGLFDYFKLKASYGQLGNDLVDPFQYLTSYAFSPGMIFGDGRRYRLALAQSGTPNPFITWEVANVFNTGFESALLDGKLFLNTDLFYQRRSQILIQRDASVPLYTGISLPDENYGIVDNRGFEIELGYMDHSGDFSYRFNGNVAFARNKIIEFDEPARSVPWQERTGQPQDVSLLYKMDGIFRDWDHVNSLPHVPGARPGDIIIHDYDGDGVITSDDRIFFHRTRDPEWTFGMNFRFGYRNWSMEGLIQGAGATMMPRLKGLTGTAGNYYAYEAANRWTPDNIDATAPRAYERTEEYWRVNYPTEWNYVEGGYARLKNIQISYSIPSRLINMVGVSDARLYMSGNNVLLLYNGNDLFDPEQGSISNYPIMKTYAVGATLTF